MTAQGHQSETRERLLDAAERLFAEKGWAGASIREITQAAETNLAAAHYHFGSKEALLAAVLERHVGKVTQARLALLDEAEARGPASLKAIVNAFVTPILAQADDADRGARLTRLVGRTFGDPEGPWRSVCDSKPIEEMRARFFDAISRGMPELQPADVHWRMEFLMGSLAHVVLHGELISKMSRGVIDPTDLERARAELIAFLAAGLAAPPNPR